MKSLILKQLSPLVAARNKGIPELLEAIKDIVDNGKPDDWPEQQVVDSK